MPVRHLAAALALLLAALAAGPAGASPAEPPATQPEPAAPEATPQPPAATAEEAPRESGRRGKRSPKDLPPRYREWLEEVTVLITPQERETFLALEQEHQLEAFIERFWEVRDPFPDTARNELKDQWDLRVSEARSEFGNLVEARARHLLLNGFPPTRIRSNCSQLLWPLEVWIYPPSERVREVLVLVFVQQWGLGRPRLWEPMDGLSALVQGPTLGSVPSDILSQVALTCANGDQIAGAISHVLRMGMVQYSTLLATAERPETGERREWVATFHAGSTDIPAGAESLAAELRIGYPGRRQARTLVQASLLVPREAAGRAELGGHTSFNFLLNGEILIGRRLFDAFRYKFDLPADRAPERIPLTFERLLRPGTYKMIVRLEDLNGQRFHRAEIVLEVPEIEGEVGPPPPDEETARLLAEANAAISTGDTAIRIIVPRGDMLAGMVRFDTLVTGDDVAQVAFSLDGRPLLTKTRPPFSVELDLGNMPRTRTLRAEAADAEGRVVAHDELLINASAHRFATRLIEPQSGRKYRDSLRAEVAVELPEGGVVERVEIFLNETRVATLYQEPFVQPVVLPPGEPVAYVRAVAYLPDGNSTEDAVFINAPDYLEEVDVQFVEVYATVLDREKRPVADLAREAFTVLEDGAPQQLLRFEKVENLPVHVGLLLDTSASMEKRLPVARDAALSFLQQTIQPRDRATVITFNDRPSLGVKFTNDPALLASGLAGLKAERSTALYDTVVFSLFYFNGIRGQRALLLLSDGRDEGSRFSYEDTLDFARRAGVAIYTIGLDIPRREFDTRRILSRFADETGGRSFFVKDASELPEIYAAIERELRTRYLLAYQSGNPARDGKFRTIEVKVEGSGLEVKAMRGYYP
ncbi:MAG: VWA domain-containing protein [Thermoanaerobaculia bacterium]|nr:VWA domain-containing protein [Thermoanaerobaculia bacterium]